MCALFKFNLNDNIECLGRFGNYGKLRGLWHAYKCGLSVSNSGYIFCDEYDDIDMLKNENSESIFMCRPDAPMGQGRYLPRGFDAKPDDLPELFMKIKKKCDQAIIILFKHPSELLTGKYLPRYKTQGAAMVVIKKACSIKIEYIGPGFDVGDITRGKAAHTSVTIPWDLLGTPESKLLRYAKTLGCYYQINTSNYLKSRKGRIQELTDKFGYLLSNEIEASLPQKVPIMTLDLFTDLYVDCIEKVLFSSLFHTVEEVGILINFYNGVAYVFELWSPERTYQCR